MEKVWKILKVLTIGWFKYYCQECYSFNVTAYWEIGSICRVECHDCEAETWC